MFDVLAFVFDNYLHRDACPELPTLHRQLSAVGFELCEIQDALTWLEELQSASCGLPWALPPDPINHLPNAAPDESLRVLTTAEQNRLGCAAWGYVQFLVSVGALPRDRLELVLERAMAAKYDELSVDDVKLIVLMVFWSLDEEPEALVLDDLCDNSSTRLAH